MKPDATLTLTGLHEPLKEFDGSPIVRLDAEGNPILDDQQVTFGGILLGLLSRMEVPAEPKKIIAARRVGEKIAEAMDGDGTYTAGFIAVEVLRAAAKTNGPGYTMPIMAQVWCAIGDGSEDNGEA